MDPPFSRSSRVFGPVSRKFVIVLTTTDQFEIPISPHRANCEYLNQQAIEKNYFVTLCDVRCDSIYASICIFKVELGTNASF